MHRAVPNFIVRTSAVRVPADRPVSRRARSGFSLIEMMVVLVVAGIVMAIAFPKTKTLRDMSSVRSAKQQFGSYMSTTRAAAIRQSLQSQFTIASNAITSTVTQADGTTLTLGRAVALNDQFGVAVTRSGSTANDVVTYDPRGFAQGLGGSLVYVFTKNSSKDSLCITKLGMIARVCGQ